DRPQLGCQPPHGQQGIGGNRAGPRPRSARGSAAAEDGAGPPAGRLRTGYRRPAGAVPGHHRPAGPRGVAPARLRGRLHHPQRAGTRLAPLPGRRARAAVRDRPGGAGTKWIILLMSLTSRTKGAAACTPSATYSATRDDSTSTSSRRRTSPPPSASTSAPSSTWAESRRVASTTT